MYSKPSLEFMYKCKDIYSKLTMQHSTVRTVSIITAITVGVITEINHNHDEEILVSKQNHEKEMFDKKLEELNSKQNHEKEILEIKQKRWFNF